MEKMSLSWAAKDIRCLKSIELGCWEQKGQVNLLSGMGTSATLDHRSVSGSYISAEVTAGFSLHQPLQPPATKTRIWKKGVGNKSSGFFSCWWFSHVKSSRLPTGTNERLNLGPLATIHVPAQIIKFPFFLISNINSRTGILYKVKMSQQLSCPNGLSWYKGQLSFMPHHFWRKADLEPQMDGKSWIYDILIQSSIQEKKFFKIWG